VHVPPEIEAKKESKHRKKFALDICMAVVHTVTMLAVVWYAIVTSRILAKMTEANQSARDAIRLQQRPWVGIDDTEGALETTTVRFDDKGDAHIGYRIRVRTFNNSAAQNVWPVAVLMITEDLTKIRAKVNAVCSNAATSDSGNVVFPGRPRLDTRSASLVQRSEMQSLTGKYEAWLIGCIAYRDSFGAMYHTGFIYWLTDPKTNLGLEFDARPNTKIDGHWATWFGSID
jgi:hypothetical protein